MFIASNDKSSKNNILDEWDVLAKWALDILGGNNSNLTQKENMILGTESSGLNAQISINKNL